MNGSEALVWALADSGVEICFVNPGTTELELTIALEECPRIETVLCLTEGVCAGAADGYGRMTGKPAATLLHQGVGLSNALANLHNARRAGTPIVNLVGEHARDHVHLDTPLTSDNEPLARSVSSWVHRSHRAEELAWDARLAVAAALGNVGSRAGAVSTLLVPADCSRARLGEGGISDPGVLRPNGPLQRRSMPKLSGLDAQTALFLGGRATLRASLEVADAIAARTGCQLLTETFAPRVDGGPSLGPVERLPYFPEPAVARLQGLQKIVLVGADEPVSFFGYEGLPARLLPPSCLVETLATKDDDPLPALLSLLEGLESQSMPPRKVAPLEANSLVRRLAAMVAEFVPAESIISQSAAGFASPVQNWLHAFKKHSWLNLSGGAIGQGGPVGLGAAIACPERPVYCLLGDGSAAYNLQFLWSCARRQAKVTSIIYANQSYSILDLELERMGLSSGAPLKSLNLTQPEIKWVDLAAGFGVEGIRCTQETELRGALLRSQTCAGPLLIEIVLPGDFEY